MNLSTLPSEEREAVERLQKQFGRGFGLEIEAGHVRWVNLSECELEVVPPEVFALRQLTQLWLHNNQLTSVPSELGQLAQLTTLFLSNNQLTSVPSEFGQLTQLTELYLSNNQLTSVPPELGQLTQLIQLWLHNNQLTSVPSELGQLTQLTELSLHNNQLTSVPPKLGQLAQLTELSLSNNQLTSVPSELGQLTQLTALWLHNNPLPDPYPELARRGSEAVLAYLRSLSEPERVVTLREARLILVGNGKVGKTQLKNALLGHAFQEEAPTTHGIEINRQERLTLPCADGGELALTIWDFGGQETYEVTHQFFYGKRSIYVLVWHPRAADQERGVEAWLRKLKLRLGDDARVIIVATHKHTDKRPADLDLIGLKQKFGDIVLGFYTVENNSRDIATNGIPELKAALGTAANKLSLMGMRVNRDWLTVREEITRLSMTETCIPRARFIEIAEQHGLTPVFAAVWLDLLHDLGDLLHYSQVDGLTEFVVLRPDWLTGAIARVLDDAEVLKKRGLLDHARFRELWKEYDAALYPFLHAVMEQFDICCREKGHEWSLVGEKVPHERPADLPTPTENQLRMVYEFDDEPPGLMPWLIVRNYRFTDNKHWRLGTYLKYDGHGALVEFDRGTRQLSLNVHGPFPLYFFVLLQDGIDWVLRRWEGLKDKVRRLIPCGQTREDGTKCPAFFQLKQLQAAAAKSKSLQCNECLEDADPARLLAGIGVRQEPLIDQLRDIIRTELKPVREDIQHSHRTLLRAIGSESRHAPRLFSMWPKSAKDRSWWEKLTDLRKLGSKTYEVWLWCEHIEQPHPVKRYEVPVAAEWLRKIAPYANLIATAIKAGLPVLGAGLGLYLDHIGATKADMKEIAERIDTMKKIAEKCLSGELDTGRKRDAMKDGLSNAEGAALREFHALLKEIDKPSHWGDLRPTATKEGDYLWLCPEHHKLFNPGLITIPEPPR